MRVDLTLDLAELFAYTRDIFDAIRLVNPVDDSVVSKEDVTNENLDMFEYLMQQIWPIADAILDDTPETVVMACTECLKALEPYHVRRAVAVGSSNAERKFEARQAKHRDFLDMVRGIRHKMSDEVGERRIHQLN